MTNTQKYILIALIAFCIGFGTAWLLVGRQVSTTEKMTASNTSDYSVIKDTGEEGLDASDTDTSVISEKFQTDTIIVKDQPAGTAVSIDSVTFEKGGWVAIYEENELGKPGKILGAQRFGEGKDQEGKVELLRGTVVGGKYFALLLNDNGDGAFDSKKDMPMTDKAGEVIMSAFKAN